MLSGKYMLTWKPSVSNIQTVSQTYLDLPTFGRARKSVLIIIIIPGPIQYNSTKTLIHYVDPSNETGDPDRSASPECPAKSGSDSILTLGENRNRYLAFFSCGGGGGEGGRIRRSGQKTKKKLHILIKSKFSSICNRSSNRRRWRLGI